MVRRMASILLVEFRSRNTVSAEEETVLTLHESGSLECSIQTVKETVNQMIAAGSRYRNIENSLGVGCALVLGKDVPESK